MREFRTRSPGCGKSTMTSITKCMHGSFNPHNSGVRTQFFLFLIYFRYICSGQCDQTLRRKRGRAEQGETESRTYFPTPVEGEKVEVKQLDGLSQPENAQRGISVAEKEDARTIWKGGGRIVRTNMDQKAPTYVGLGTRGGKLKSLSF